MKNNVKVNKRKGRLKKSVKFTNQPKSHHFEIVQKIFFSVVY